MNDPTHSELFELETLLRGAAAALVYPATPNVVAAVSARLREERPSAGLFEMIVSFSARPVARFAMAAVAVAAVILGGALAVPRSRDALADFFGLSHVFVDREPSTGPTPPELSPQSFAKPSKIEEVQGALDFPLRFPTRNGARLDPSAMYLAGLDSNLPIAIFVFEDEGYDLYQTRQGFFGKGGPDPSLIHDISFGGRPAYWIDEGGHIATFLDEQGRLVVESRRTVDRATLLWERDGITYRLETNLSQAEAIQVAESLR